jgi:hypothetical protein
MCTYPTRWMTGKCGLCALHILNRSISSDETPASRAGKHGEPCPCTRSTSAQHMSEASSFSMRLLKARDPLGLNVSTLTLDLAEADPLDIQRAPAPKPYVEQHTSRWVLQHQRQQGQWWSTPLIPFWGKAPPGICTGRRSCNPRCQGEERRAVINFNSWWWL